jgi:ABC-type nitrate/sulfonate/bicarbonate transport system substrate-binding protein
MKLSRLQALGAIPAVTLTPGLVRAQPAPLTVRVASTNTEFAVPLAYAARSGIFERAGLKVEASRMGSGAAIAAAVVAGAEVQPVIDVAVKYKVIEKGYAASELLSDVLAK